MSDLASGDPILLGREQPPPEGSDVTQLERAVGSIAAIHRGTVPPEAPWRDPLPPSVDEERRTREMAALTHEHGPSVVVGVLDDPDRRSQPPLTWRPAAQGLVVYGAPDPAGRIAGGSVLAACRQANAAELHVYVLSDDPLLRARIAALPHCAGVFDPADLGALRRLLHRIETADLAASSLLVADRIGSLLDTLVEDGEHELAARLARIVTDGTRRRVRVVATAPSARSLSQRLSSSFEVAVACAGVDASLFAEVSEVGRLSTSVDLRSGLEIALVEPTADELAAAAAHARCDAPAPVPVAVIPPVVWPSQVAAVPDVCGRELRLPVGIEVDTGDPAILTLTDTALVVGRPGTGRTAVLAAMAETLENGGGPAAAWWCDRDREADGSGPVVRLVDDADEIDEASGARLLELASSPGSWIVAAVRPQALRGLGWINTARTSGVAAVLQPGVGDIEAWGPRSRRARHDWPAGRGVAVHHGVAAEVQFACGRPVSTADRPGLRQFRNG